MAEANDKHLLITRFSLRASSEDPVPSAEWLAYRLRLFEAYCLPTVAAQTVRSFEWILLCDERTDPDALARLERLLESIPEARVVPTDPDRPYLEELLGRVGPEHQVLASTRLDNDDGLGPRYVERVASYLEAFRSSGLSAQLLCFPQGCTLDATTGRLYDSYQPNSPIVTLLERLEGDRAPSTIYAGNHGYLSHRFPVHHDSERGLWLQVVHGANVSNSVRRADYLLPAEQLTERFPVRPEIAAGLEGVAAAQPDDADGRTGFRANLERPAAEGAGQGGGRAPGE